MFHIRYCTILLFILSVCVGQSTNQEENVTPDSLSGTWTRIQKLPDGSQISIMKIITPTHFAAFQKDTVGVKHELFQAHSGRYTLEKDLMSESYLYSSNPQLVGKSAQCQVAIDGDTLRQTWKSGDGKTAVEVWTREQVKPNEKIAKPSN